MELTQQQIIQQSKIISDTLDNIVYEHKPRVTDGEFEKQVNEYVTPNGERGIEVILFITKNNKTFCKVQGVGAEAIHRNHNWQEIT